jgi:hypothetical protein
MELTVLCLTMGKGRQADMKETREWLAGRSPDEPLLRSKKPGRNAPSTAAEDESFADISVKRDALRMANHRDGDRHRLPQESVEILHDGERQVVALINLSGGGAMIEGAAGLKLWDRVLLQLGDCGQIEAAVRWIRGDRHGLEFAHETRIDASPEDTDRMLRAVISRSFPDVVAKAEARDQDQSSPAAAASSEVDPADRRDEVQRDLRHPLIWSGLIHYSHDTYAVRLRNISAGGALIEGVSGLPLGAELLLDLDAAGAIFATVTWAHGDTAGLKFHAPFDLQLLAASKPVVASQRWVAPDYLRDSHSAHGPWAKQWGRSDLDEMHRNLGS